MRTARVLTRLSTSRRRLSGARSLSSGVLPSHALSSSSFPTVDVGGLLPEAASDRRAAAHESLRAALVGDDAPGFFYALDAPDALSRAYLDDVYDFVSRAHDLPAGVKSKFADPELGSGELGCAYNGPDVGHLEPSYDGVSTATASAWDYSPHGAARAGGGWDAALPCDFAATFEDLYARQNAVGRAVLVGVAEVLGLPPDTFARSFDEGDLGTIRLISYPGYDEPVHTFTTANANSGDHSWTYYDEDTLHPADVGIAPHTDFEAFTLMHQDAPGLQLLTRGELDKGADADWIDAPVADAFVVIVGDVLERYTNGVLRATPHRVVRRANARRSIIRFNAVAPDELVAPLPAFGEPRYTPVTMRNHMDTTLRNLRQGIPSWDAEANTSRSATYVYE
mmetsp:Transcript_7461/g.23472  ORF Transcript_7461/g.23472 Transcript_7461/m.23472 type:complete len:395 (+) Transcript_7461:151-1335(+)